MQTLRLVVRPLSAFATPPFGDSLFGQLCWTLRHGYGEAALAQWLEGYTRQAPFAVLSDFLPRGYVGRPTLPLHKLGLRSDDPAARKRMKQLRWLPVEALGRPLNEWHAHLQPAPAAGDDERGAWVTTGQRMHNTINRQTLTTGSGEQGFAPWQRRLHWYAPGTELECYVCIDTQRIRPEQVLEAFSAMGLQGFGKDASTGCGRFEVLDETIPWPQSAGEYRLTLAPCVPEAEHYRADTSYCEPFTRFGRHGDLAVHAGNPFKNPVLMAQSHALLHLQDVDARPYVGRGLSGVSRSLPATVHQGYAPALPVVLSSQEVAP